MTERGLAMASKYKITQHIATISQADDGSTLELNLIRWNGRAEKYDLRRWDRTPDGERVVMKGISLSQAEYEMLRGILSKPDSADVDIFDNLTID